MILLILFLLGYRWKAAYGISILYIIMDFKKSISQKIVHQDGKNNKADSNNCCFGFINKTG